MGSNHFTAAAMPDGPNAFESNFATYEHKLRKIARKHATEIRRLEDRAKHFKKYQKQLRM